MRVKHFETLTDKLQSSIQNLTRYLLKTNNTALKPFTQITAELMSQRKVLFEIKKV